MIFSLLQDKRSDIFVLLLGFSLSLFFPVIIFLFFTCFFLLKSFKSKDAFRMFLSYSFLFFSFIISQKMIGKGNDDFAVYIKMLIKGGYPSWEDKPYDFFFWLIAKIVYSITGNESLFIFIICKNKLLFFYIF